MTLIISFLICVICVPLQSQPVQKPRIVIYKSARKLEFYSDKALLHTYRIGLGFSPVADKLREGDGATPEGDFYVFVKNNKSAYYLSLGVSYPNVEDAARGLRDGLITKAQHAGDDSVAHFDNQHAGLAVQRATLERVVQQVSHLSR